MKTGMIPTNNQNLGGSDQSAVPATFSPALSRSAADQRLLVISQTELKEIVKAAMVEVVGTPQEGGNQRQAAPLRVNIAQLAERLGKSQRTVAEWKRRRIIPFEKIGRNLMFDVVAVDAALKKYRRNAAGY